MRLIIKYLLSLLILAALADGCKYIYKVGSAPQVRSSVNPYSMGVHGK